jgi:hypothetical protein
MSNPRAVVLVKTAGTAGVGADPAVRTSAISLDLRQLRQLRQGYLITIGTPCLRATYREYVRSSLSTLPTPPTLPFYRNIKTLDRQGAFNSPPDPLFFGARDEIRGAGADPRRSWRQRRGSWFVRQDVASHSDVAIHPSDSCEHVRAKGSSAPTTITPYQRYLRGNRPAQGASAEAPAQSADQEPPSPERAPPGWC